MRSHRFDVSTLLTCLVAAASAVWLLAGNAGAQSEPPVDDESAATATDEGGDGPSKADRLTQLQNALASDEAKLERLRLERALSMLSHGRPGSLTEIALACGFASASDFSRSFKQRYGKPPSGP